MLKDFRQWVSHKFARNHKGPVQLVANYRGGRVVIPEFQREYVWKPNRAPKLVDSFYWGFPISSLLLWQSSEEARARRRDPRPERSANISWLIDGQQRVIGRLVQWLETKELMSFFHPENDEFRLANAATRNDRNWFAADLWDDELFRQLHEIWTGILC